MTVVKIELPQDQNRLGTNTAGIKVNEVPFDAPWLWLDKGWKDLWKIPGISLVYGAAFALAALVLFLSLFSLGWVSLMLPLAGGFLLIGPGLAIGLYSASKKLEEGETVTFGNVCSTCSNAPGQILFMGIILLIIFFVWMEIAFLLFMLFMGTSVLPHVSEFVPTLLFSAQGLGLLIVGTIAGAILGLFVFAISAISVPLLMDRDIDAVSAAAISVSAVRKNPRAMLLWMVLIAALMVFGLATLFVGLVFAFPLIGHATWHAYRGLVAHDLVAHDLVAHDEADANDA